TTRRCVRLSSPARARGLLIVLFVVLVAAFAAGLWGTILRPAAYEVQGEIVALAAPDLLLVRHEAIAGLGMSAMETMAVRVAPSQLTGLSFQPGDRVRLVVRPQGDDLVLVRIEKR
ncbi:MAG TPA: copper-binding protein, partial [Methylomirabilota bacterium]